MKTLDRLIAATAIGLLLGAAAIALAHAYTPLVCERTWTGEICYQMSVNPSAKIIHIEPFERVDPGTVYAAPDVPLPRPRPPGLGVVPPRQVIQQ